MVRDTQIVAVKNQKKGLFNRVLQQRANTSAWAPDYDDDDDGGGGDDDDLQWCQGAQWMPGMAGTVPVN